MKYYNKSKKKSLFKKIGLAVAGVGALGLATLGVSKGVSYLKADTKELNLSYEVGALNSNGEYVEDESRIYTKEKFACDGLKVLLDFDSTINYQVFYYDILDNYVDSTEILDNGYSGISPLNGAYARVVITPLNDEDNKVSFLEKYKYGNQLTINVNKNAEENLKEKYTSFCGYPLTYVNNVSEVVFDYGYLIEEDEFRFEEDANHSWATTRCLLNVNDFNDMVINQSSDAEGVTIRFYEFYDEKVYDGVSYGFKNCGLIKDNDYSFNISECSYVLLSFTSTTPNLLKNCNLNEFVTLK